MLPLGGRLQENQKGGDPKPPGVRWVCQGRGTGNCERQDSVEKRHFLLRTHASLGAKRIKEMFVKDALYIFFLFLVTCYLHKSQDVKLGNTESRFIYKHTLWKKGCLISSHFTQVHFYLSFLRFQQI